MSKVWFYGDSFTAGAGLNFKEYMDKTSSNYIEGYDIYNDSHWENINFFKRFTWKHQYEDSLFSNHFSNSLKLDCINRGEVGASNERILHKIFSDLKDFTPDDIIVIGMTAYSRVLVPNFSKAQRMTNAGYDGVKDQNFLLADNKIMSEDAEKAIVDFCYEVLHKNEKSVEDYYSKLFKQIRLGLLTKVSSVMIWDYSLWHLFERITIWSKGLVDDGHWSPNGHKAFAEYLLENYHQNNHILFKQKTVI
jgi:hypothetical protein